MIKISLKASDQRVKQAIENRRAQIRAALTAEMDRLMLELERRIQQKLSGEVLQSRRGGGGLLGSVHREKTIEISGRLVGRVTAGGGLASIYPIVQEKGGERTYDIFPGIVTGKSDKKALAFFPGGSLGAGALATQGRKLTFKLGARRGALRPQKYGEFSQLGGIVVRHVVHPPLVARPYMSTAQAEMRETIIARLRAVLAREVA
jgi:hypothetical protein